MFVRRFIFVVFALVVATVSLATAQSAPAPKPAASASPLPASPAPEPTGSAVATPAPVPSAPPAVTPAFPFSFASPGPLQAQNYTAFLRGATQQSGVINIIRKDDDLYFDLGPDNFGKTYIIAPSLASGVGSGAFAGKVYEPFLITFKRVGKRVLWISPNTHYVAQKGSAEANSLAISVADTVLVSSPILAEDAAKTHTVIAPSLFLTDFEGIGADLGRGSAPAGLPGLLQLIVRPNFAVDMTKSYYLGTKAFPRNDEISVNLTFNGPANSLPTVPDGRGIPLIVHYSVVQPPERDPNFVPRYADDRLGYFITARKRYDDDALSTPLERFIERWNLDNGPIVYYLTNEIPQQYKGTVRRAILAWNDALAKAGHPNAIEVRDQPADPTWDPEDARYTTVRWITSDRSDFAAYSPLVVDPETGQIIRAGVVIDGESMRIVKRGYIDTIVPAQRNMSAFAPAAAQLQQAAESPGIDAFSCLLADKSLSQAALGMQMLIASPHATVADRAKYADQWLYSTVLHEVGHTLGLRHNFQGSTAYTTAQLHDPNFTRTHGTTGSVMDYTPVNLAAPGQRQADYFPNHLGPYDYWVIDYGYHRFGVKSSSAELPYLAKIAARSTQPGLAYGNDEDADDRFAVDPRIQQFDLSSDPLRYDSDQFAINESIAKGLDRHYPGDTRSYADLRASLVTVLNNEVEAADLAAHYVGGIYTSRAHRGQPGGEPPFRSIPRAEQKRAFDLLARYVFSSKAFTYSPALLNDLSPNRYGFHWNSSGVGRADFPMREIIAQIQDIGISVMFSPANLSRIADQQMKVAHTGDTMTLADLFAWTNDALFDDLGRSTITPSHRDFQRRFTDLEMEIATISSFQLESLSLPRDVQALARVNLAKISRRLNSAVIAAKDPGTRAHLDDLRSRINTTLEAKLVRPI
jgi:hypothetical protein